SFNPPWHSALFFYVYVHLRDLHSFPTRRSSDLRSFGEGCCFFLLHVFIRCFIVVFGICFVSVSRTASSKCKSKYDSKTDSHPLRSEEHTSELQSRFDLVCRLLLEKKKIQHNNIV